MEEILKISRENGYRHVFYGSTQETLDKIQARIKREYPDTEENFLYISPEFKETAEPETEEIINKINDFKPDFVWVGNGRAAQRVFIRRRPCGRVRVSYEQLLGQRNGQSRHG